MPKPTMSDKSKGDIKGESWEERFDEKFELHDLGKDEFTLCCNNGDGTCDGGISIQREREAEAKRHLIKVKTFIQKEISKAREEERERVMEIIEQFDGYDCGKTGCKDQVRSILKAIKEENMSNGKINT